MFPLNIGSHLSIDETSLTNGELYTIIINKKRRHYEGALVAMIKGTKSEDVCQILKNIPKSLRAKVKEVTLDMSNSMDRIVRERFPNVELVIDRFHVQQLISQALQDMRIKYRWDAIQQENDAIKQAKANGTTYISPRFENGDTLKQLLARSRYLLFKPSGKWTESQKIRAFFKNM